MEIDRSVSPEQIRYYLDDTNIFTVNSPIYSTSTATGGTQTLAVSGSGRYVRLTGTQRTTQYGYSLWEFGVYGS